MGALQGLQEFDLNLSYCSALSRDRNDPGSGLASLDSFLPLSAKLLKVLMFSISNHIEFFLEISARKCLHIIEITLARNFLQPQQTILSSIFSLLTSDTKFRENVGEK